MRERETHGDTADTNQREDTTGESETKTMNTKPLQSKTGTIRHRHDMNLTTRKQMTEMKPDK